MVRKQAENGAWYHGPPYTWEESRDFYRAMSGGPVTVVILRCLRKMISRKAVNHRRNRWKNNLFAEALNSRGVATAGGGSWYPSNVLARG
jgi:glucan phosphoethanolaminetransferase (alkaline phosphatase superfamily)